MTFLKRHCYTKKEINSTLRMLLRLRTNSSKSLTSAIWMYYKKSFSTRLEKASRFAKISPSLSHITTSYKPLDKLSKFHLKTILGLLLWNLSLLEVIHFSLSLSPEPEGHLCAYQHYPFTQTVVPSLVFSSVPYTNTESHFFTFQPYKILSLSTFHVAFLQMWTFFLQWVIRVSHSISDKI